VSTKTRRNYKEEYRKYGSSEEAKAYRAELNAHNRKKGTYGNGDGLDASHSGGRIRGWLREKLNRANNRPKRRASKGK